MSVESIGLVLNHSRAKGTAKLVLVGIANHDGDGGAWPSIATLARYANTSERSVQRSIEVLVELGELEVEVNAGGTAKTPNDRRPNRYLIVLKPTPEAVDNSVGKVVNGVTPVSPRRSSGVTLVTQRGDASVVNGVTPVSPEPSYNHPEPAAAAAAQDLDDITRLRFAFADHPELTAISFTMSAKQREEIIGLITEHGNRKLAATAAATKTGPVRRATAFLDTWRSLPTRRDFALLGRLQVGEAVLAPRCPECDQPLSECTAMNQKLAPADRCGQHA